MTVFIRTSKGQQAAYEPGSELPRKLRSILKLIDGRTSLGVFEQNLKSFGDVRSIFYSLIEAGLIAEAAADGEYANGNFYNNDADRQLLQPRTPSNWMPTRSPYADQPPLSLAATSDLLGAYAHLNAETPAPVTDEKKEIALKSVVNDMSGFVLTHMPDQSFLLLKEIEEIASIEMLAATLGGYEQMVSHLGYAGEAHLQAIRQTVREYL